MQFYFKQNILFAPVGGLGLESHPWEADGVQELKTSSDYKVDFEAWATWDSVSKETKNNVLFFSQMP